MGRSLSLPSTGGSGVLLLLLALVCLGGAVHVHAHAYRFPSGFMWGAATASYQIEGAAFADGRLQSEWDMFSHTPGKTANGATGDVADRSYELYDQDADLLRNVGFQHYRFSLSWGRLINVDGTVNPRGVAHYRAVIASLLKRNIQPFVTLFHWDLPLIYSTMTGQGNGWLNASIVPHFVNYADIAFREFGDQVKSWLTFNEPLSFCQIGYDAGVHAPGRCSNRTICAAGDSSREPYLCTHNVLLSHGAAVKLYRDKYQKQQGGKIGITLNSDWSVPLTDSAADRAAAQRNLDFMLGWFADPIFLGDYPDSMKRNVGARLPVFTTEQKALIKGSHDFFGLNHYTSAYISNRASPPPSPTSWFDDQGVESTRFKDGKPIGPKAASDWLYVVPWAFKHLLLYVNNRYKSPIYVTENGVDVPDEDTMPLAQALNDTFRIDYYNGYLQSVADAIKEGADIRGYFAWSLLDNFEWADGYSKRFGMTYVDYKDNERRYPKASSAWFRDYISRETAPAEHKEKEDKEEAPVLAQASSRHSHEQRAHELRRNFQLAVVRPELF